MAHPLSNPSRKIMTLASEAARSFNHDYVGTEHILLALMQERSAGMSDVLESLEIDADKLRAEVERLVERGPKIVTLHTLPLTPRAARAIEVAHNEARLMNETCIDAEHLFLGLMSEPLGVACQALVNLGVEPAKLTKEVFKTRLAQMRIVERAVRPLKASTARKRKMRDELFTHLAAVYDQEQERLHDPAAALAAATSRFGNPDQLAEQLQAALPFHERINFFAERWFAWWPPESAAKSSLRQAALAFGVFAAALPLLFVGFVVCFGPPDDVWTIVRALTAFVLLAPLVQFVGTFAWIKMRDSMWGVFGSRKSLARALAYDALFALVVASSSIVFVGAARWNLGAATGAVPFAVLAGLVSAVWAYLIVRWSGAATIRDTLWAMLDTETA